MVSPLVTATTLQPFGDRAGSASALLGFIQMGGASIGVTMMAAIASPTLAVGLVQALLTMLGFVLYLTGMKASAAR
jgi:DHA1 family bicyclomycin/chloramphenicol resistance-like MFS transporter